MAWYNTEWLYRQKYSIDYTKIVGGNKTNFAVKIDLSTLNSAFWSHVQNGGGDIRITNSSGTVELAREVVSCDTSLEEGMLVVKIDSLSSSVDTDIYIYYGNSEASDYAASHSYGKYNAYPSSYQAVWHLDEYSDGSGAVTRNDSTSNGNHLTDINTVVSAGGKLPGNGANFETSNASERLTRATADLNADFPGKYGGNTPSGFTLSLWFNPETIGNGSHINALCTFLPVSGDNFYILYSNTNGTITDGGNLGGAISSTAITATGNWVHLAIVWNGSQTQIYINGQANGSPASLASFPVADSTGLFRIGGKNNTMTTRQTDGIIDEIIILNAALSAGDIETLYNNENSPATFTTGAWTEENAPEPAVGISITSASFLLTANAIDLIPSFVYPGTSWATKTPAEVGINSTKLDAFVDAIDNLAGTAGVIIKDGYLIKEWGTQTTKFDWASAAKPVISSLLFFAAAENLITGVDELARPHVQSLLSQDLITKDQTMEFEHLANMVSGYTLPENPGAAWSYNDYALQLYVKLLFDEVFGDTADNIATNSSRLGAIGLQDGTLFSSRDGYGVSTTPRDFARIGWLWLNRFRWNGVQLIPPSYYDNYVKPYVTGSLAESEGGTPNDYLSVGSYGGGVNQTPYGPGIYGYGFWYNASVGTTSNTTWHALPSDAFQANGHFTREICLVIPSLKMVVAAKGEWGTFEPGNPSSGMNQNLKLLMDAAGIFIVNPAFFDLTTNEINFSSQRKIPVTAASFSLTTQPVSLRAAKRMSIESASLNAAANDVYLRADRKVGIDNSGFVITTSGINFQYTRSYSLSIDSNSFQVTTHTLNLKADRKIQADTATFNITQQDLNLKADRKIILEAADYTLATFNINLQYSQSYSLSIDSASFFFTGQDINLRADRRVSIDTAGYALTAFDIALRQSHLLNIDLASFALAAQQVNLKAGRKVNLAAGSFVLTGEDVNLKADRKVSIEAGAYLLTASNVNLQYLQSLTLSIDPASFALTVNQVNLRANRKINVAAASYNLDTLTVGFRADRRIPINTTSYTLNVYDLHFARAYSLSIDASLFELISNQVNLLAGRKIGVTPANFLFTEYPLGLKVNRKLNIATAGYLLNFFNVNLQYSPAFTLSIDPALFQLTAHRLNLRADRTIDIRSGDFNLTTFPLSLFYTVPATQLILRTEVWDQLVFNSQITTELILKSRIK